MPLRDHLFTIDPPCDAPGIGWCTAVRGHEVLTLGPFASERDAMLGLHRVFARWRRRAQQRGGFLWRQTAWRWVVTLPPDVPCGGLPFVSEACTKAVESGQRPSDG